MLESALTGVVAAVVVFLPRYFFINFTQINWSLPVFILAVGLFGVIIQKYLLAQTDGIQSNDGLADLSIYIHFPLRRDSASRWLARSCISFLLVLFGGVAGPEGAAIELIQSLRMKWHYHSSKWFEQRRRTDVATSLAAGISAAFGAPFAGALLPMELGMGGRSVSVIASSLFAFLGVRFLLNYFSLQFFDVSGILSGFHFSISQKWVSAPVIGLASGLVGLLSVRFIRYTQESLKHLFQAQVWMRMIAGAFLLAFVHYLYQSSSLSVGELLEEVFWAKHTGGRVALYFFTQLLSLSLVFSAFGTIGIFWPLFALGGFFGFCVNHWVFAGTAEYSAAIGLMGAVSFWAVLLDAPLSGAVLAYEITQNSSILLPCLIAGLAAQQVRKLSKTSSLMDRDLASEGFSLVNGRSMHILKSIMVKDAMVTDHELVHEQESVPDLQSRLLKSRYPFLLVVNTQGIFTGLLTLDVVQDAWKVRENEGRESHFAKLVEAKDLLYRNNRKITPVKATDRLSDVIDIFEELPCTPVLGEDGRVVGLLFVQGVRLAYEREVARLSYFSGILEN